MNSWRFILSVVFLAVSMAGNATWYNSVGTGNWINDTSWNGTGYPVNGDGAEINSGHVITYDGNLIWTSSQISVESGGKLIVNGDLTISNSANLYIKAGGVLEVTGTVYLQNTSLSIGESSQLSVEGDLSVAKNLDVGSSAIVNVGNSLIIGGNLNNSGEVVVEDDLDVTGQTNNKTSQTMLDVGGDFHSGGNLNNSGTVVVDGDLTLNTISDADLNVNSGLVVVNGDLTKSGNIAVSPGSDIIVVGTFYSEGGNTWIQNGADFYVFGTSNCSGSNCSLIQDYTDWESDGNQGGQYVIYSPPAYCSGNAVAVVSFTGVPDSGDAVGAPDNNGSQLHETNDGVTLDIAGGNILLAGGTVDARWRRSSNNATQIRVEISVDGSAWTEVATYTINTQNTWLTQTIPLSIDTRFIQFTSVNGWDLDLDAVSYNTPCRLSDPLEITTTHTDISCVGQNDGEINASGSGGQSPYQYKLNAGSYQSSGTFTGLAAGNYTVWMKDASGTEISTLLTINLPAIPPDDQNSAGNDSWVGHFYKRADATASAPSDANAFARYLGNRTMTETFDQSFNEAGSCFPLNSNGTFHCSVYTEYFAVKYRMNSTRTGIYVADMGSDDGIRLTVDNVKVFDNWKQRGYVVDQKILFELTGRSSLLYEYYESGGGNRVSFQNLTKVPNNLTNGVSQTLCQGASTTPITANDSYTEAPISSIGSYTVTYQWQQASSAEGPWTDIDGANTQNYTPVADSPGTFYFRRELTVSKANAGLVSIPVTATDFSDIATVTVSPLPAAAGTISGPSSVNDGESGIAYSVPVVTGADNYAWSYSGTGATINGTTENITIDFAPGATSGMLTVYATNACGNGGASANFPITVSSATPGITVSPISGLETTEAGGQASFTVVLDTPPTNNVSITIESSDITEGTTDKSVLNFDDSNWNIPQTVTITGVDDPDEDGNISYTVILNAASSDDLNYHGINPDDVAVTNIDDEIPLSITCPEDQVGSVDASCNFAMPDFTGMAVIEGGQGTVVVSQSPLPGTSITANTTFTLTATDESETSVSCSAELTLIDEILPLVTCPGNQSINANANCEATLPDYTSLVNATDNCGQPLTIIQYPAPGSIISATTAVTISATDDSNNTGSCEFSVILNDVTAPLINCPANQTIEADASCDAVLPDYRSLAVVTDNCDDTPTVTQEPAPGTIISGITTVVLTATDEAGNSPSCSFQVSVADNEPPIIACPEPITVGNDPYMCSAVITDLGTPVADDNCGVAFITNDAPPIFNVGQTTVTWTVTDVNGNSNTCEQLVTVVDDEAPLISCYDNEIVYVPTSFNSIDYPFNETFFDDNCAVTDFVWTMSGATTRSSSSSGINPLGEQSLNIGTTTIQIMVRDGAGNETDCSFNINVEQVDDPTAICPGDIYLGCNPSDFPANLGEMNYYMEAGWELYSETSVLGNETAVSGADCVYERTRTYTATFRFYWWIFHLDTKVITCTRTYTYKKDTEAPSLSGVPPDATVEYNNIPTAPTVTVSDNCDAGTSLTYSQSSTQNPDVNHSGHYNYTITRTWEAIDDCENTTTSSQVITVQDTQAPQITCPDNVEEAAGPGICTRQLTIPNPVVSDNGKLQSLTWTMSGATEASSPTTGINYLGQQLFNPGETSVTYTATDVSGRTSTCSFTVAILDEEAPLVNCPVGVTASCVKDIPLPATTLAEFIALGGTVSDNCTTNDNLIFSWEDDVTDKKDAINPCEVVRTYTITDESDNVASCTQTFTISDATAPVIVDCPDDITDSADENCEKILTIAAPTNFTDGCGFGDVTVYHAYTIDGSLIEAAGGILDIAFPKGTTIITWSFEDECGNTGTCEQAITIEDNTAPTASCPVSQQLDAEGNCSALLVDYTTLLIGLNDNCDADPTVTQRPVVNTEVFADTEIWLIYADEDGNQDSCSFMVNLTNLAPLEISEMIYDDQQSGEGAVGSGQKPFITSTHPYEIDRDEAAPEDYTYTWLVLDQSGTDVEPDISFPDSNPRHAVIPFSENYFTEGETYTIRVIKEQLTGNCSAVFELDIEVQETDFNSGVEPLGPTCQDGGTGAPTVVFWDVDFTGGVEPYAFEFSISDDIDGCTGKVSNLFTNDSESIVTTEHCDATYAVAVTKESGAPAVQIAFTFISEAGVDKDFNLTIQSATDHFSITKQTINNDESDNVTLWGVPNTSDIETD